DYYCQSFDSTLRAWVF
nr:immunoglobulin light chain junction region [Macaca mulatta]